MARRQMAHYEDCPPRRRATEDHQPFGIRCDGPALPQYVVDTDGKPLSPPMVAMRDATGQWSLWRVADPDD